MGKTWLCRCGWREEYAKRKCTICQRARPKPRVPKHAETLRDDPYHVYQDTAIRVHGIADETCNICRKPRSQERRLDRDHDHKTGKPRGLLCHRCNRVLVSWVTADWCREAAAYLDRAGAA